MDCHLKLNEKQIYKRQKKKMLRNKDDKKSQDNLTNNAGHFKYAEISGEEMETQIEKAVRNDMGMSALVARRKSKAENTWRLTKSEISTRNVWPALSWSSLKKIKITFWKQKIPRDDILVSQRVSIRKSWRS